jgi:UDP-N-acetylmuramyl pentapeptide phosphotransferase/UDP-N-acetylglucosamine-1-phosphate transferase
MIVVKYIIIALLLLCLELLYFRIADRLNIIDKPNLRSSHKTITLRGGGIIFLFAVWIYAACFGLQYMWFVAGLTMIAAISFADDVSSVPNRFRIVVHFISMLLMFHQLGILTLSQWPAVLIAWIVCTYIINAYNFMDGINGITGGYSLVVLGSLAIVNHKLNFIDMNLIAILMVSLVIFCFFNFRKTARCFAGDVGAVAIAFAVVFMIFSLIVKTENVLWIMLLVVYGVDTVLTILHRLMLKENIFKPHRKHAFQLMANELKIPHTAVTSIYMAIQAAVSLGLIYLPVNQWVYSIAVILVLCAAYILFKLKYYHLHEEYLRAQNQ